MKGSDYNRSVEICSSPSTSFAAIGATAVAGNDRRRRNYANTSKRGGDGWNLIDALKNHIVDIHFSVVEHEMTTGRCYRAKIDMEGLKTEKCALSLDDAIAVVAATACDYLSKREVLVLLFATALASKRQHIVQARPSVRSHAALNNPEETVARVMPDVDYESVTVISVDGVKTVVVASVLDEQPLVGASTTEQKARVNILGLPALKPTTIAKKLADLVSISSVTATSIRPTD